MPHDVGALTDGGGSTAWASYCGGCKHWRGGGRCAAFPDGVPDAILECLADHRKPYPGDGGILYDGDPQLVEEMLRRRREWDRSVQRWRGEKGASPGL